MSRESNIDPHSGVPLPRRTGPGWGELAPASGSFADLKILDVPAGRRLDALVATHLFGWSDCATYGPAFGKNAEGKTATIPPYSLTGTDALAVLGEMGKRNFQYQILKTPKQCHMVSFTSRSGTTDESAFDDSLPEAICHAALMAVQREQKNITEEDRPSKP